MSKAYFYTAITPVTKIYLKEVDKNGDLISGGYSYSGTPLGNGIYSFNVTRTRYYSLYINDTLIMSAHLMFINGGELFESDTSNNVKMIGNLDLNGKTLTGVASGSTDGDAINFSQVKHLLSTNSVPVIMPSVSLDHSTFAQFCKIYISAPTGISKDATFIFFYCISDTANELTFALSSNGVVSHATKEVVQITTKTPYALLPKIEPWTASKYIHFGYYIYTNAGASSLKRGTTASISSSYLGIFDLFPDVSGITHSTDPIIIDMGNQLSLTIPASESSSYNPEYEFVYGFLPTGSTEPTIVANVITGLDTYSIQRSYTRSIMINKPTLAVGDYDIYVSYRFITPFSVSNWWKLSSTNKIKKLAMTKFSQKLSDADIDAIASYMMNILYADISTGNIGRK